MDILSLNGLPSRCSHGASLHNLAPIQNTDTTDPAPAPATRKSHAPAVHAKVEEEVGTRQYYIEKLNWK